jgi:DNA-binding NarL/FixJ family response regulator
VEPVGARHGVDVLVQAPKHVGGRGQLLEVGRLQRARPVCAPERGMSVQPRASRGERAAAFELVDGRHQGRRYRPLGPTDRPCNDERLDAGWQRGQGWTLLRSPIRTFIVDDHPAMRAGIAAVLERVDDITVVGAATGGRQMWRTLGPAEPDVVLMDFDLDGEDGVILCHRLKRRPDAPGVVLYTAFAGRTLISPAMLAHADALVSKRADAAVICSAIRDAARPSTPPVLPPDERERLGETLDEQELSLAALLLSRRPLDHIAEVIGMPPEHVEEEVEGLLRRLVPARGGTSP